MRTQYTSQDVMNVLRNVETVNALLAVDASDDSGPYLTPKFGPDRRPRAYITVDTMDELIAEINAFDASLI